MNTNERVTDSVNLCIGVKKKIELNTRPKSHSLFEWELEGWQTDTPKSYISDSHSHTAIKKINK